jgi:molybdopterin-guanine dinucleotide biosynthesis protein A
MLTVAVQAGGQSARMGEDKALKPFLGRPLIQRVVDRLTSGADEVIVTTNRPEAYQFLGLRCVADVRPGRGALGGLYTALHAARDPFVAVVACDLPFVSAELIAYARELLLGEEVDVAIPASSQESSALGSGGGHDARGEGLEPLHAVYRRESCLPAIEAALNADQWKVIAWFSQVKVRVLLPEECAPFDADGLAFRNVNTPEEFAAAEALARTAAR